MKIDAHGFRVDVPRGWDCRIMMRAESPVMAPAVYRAASVSMSGDVAPVLHLANFALPEGRGDYGSGAVEVMRSGSVFIAFVEFG